MVDISKIAVLEPATPNVLKLMVCVCSPSMFLSINFEVIGFGFKTSNATL